MEDAAVAQAADDNVAPVLPECGLIFSEVKYMQLQLCKPKLLPIKSYSLERLEKMEKKLAQEAKEKRDQERAQRHSATGWTSPDLRQTPPIVPTKSATTAAAASNVAAPPAPNSPLPLAPVKTATAATPAVAAIASSSTLTSPLPLAKCEASPALASGSALTEEAGADAPTSPQDHTLSVVSASEVSASSHSTTGQ